jgi:SpoVK/Ycf46/Vps4 family AAA+-type ATPase
MIKDRYELSEMVINEMMQGLNLHLKREQIDELIDFEAIQYKSMFYNPKEKDAIESLTELLGPKRYSEVCQRLEERGMRKGVACLFYGGPGTGKTETVLQLAKATGRCLMQVNISDIKSKWVGDSEKNVKKIFSHYKELVKKMDVTPILFFNEADAIINKRMENAQRSVDKMENSMQNIILQEIENLDGILIATTNLTQNLDKAFERRFLYKIEFSKPSLEAKSMIWQSMIPELSTTDAQTLAQSYDFSGGQIENIARKQIVDNIITGVPLSIDKLRQHCDTELLDKKTIRRAIGF